MTLFLNYKVEKENLMQFIDGIASHSKILKSVLWNFQFQGLVKIKSTQALKGEKEYDYYLMLLYSKSRKMYLFPVEKSYPYLKNLKLT